MTLTLAYELASLALIVAGFVGCVVFVLSYRPFDLRAHGPAGRHLLVMSWSLLLLFGLTLLFRAWDAPAWFSQPVALLVIGAIVFAVWDRVRLLRRVKREHRTGRV